ncbi:MAG TPA: efflux RND transporter periplasmic adaptor subunit [Candidatus Paceibacterota bacterium]|nr:efflux RND transporter periplasmic adaptor subunit [Verrucomicrobiota bacterium]HRY46906.1 efflux RND transporter periplasmic adaptor subunit [Candidatus Paceibacterota bacterium]HRZ99407.1 efflux RND transporter periplasmic adaptor subunit [Candidatus Paceibacterota bacterium]
MSDEFPNTDAIPIQSKAMEIGPDKAALNSLRIDRQTTRHRSRGTLGLILLFVLVLLAGGVIGWLRWPKTSAVRTGAVREIATDRNQTVLNASGYVTARRQATVSSKMTGKVLEVLVEEGLKVEENQILARLDDANMRVNLDLENARVEVVQKSIAETRALLDQAQKELRRIVELGRNQIASVAEQDRAESEVKTLEARLARQESEVRAAIRQSAVWQQQIDDAIIRAPFTGIVISKNAQPGEMISPISAGGGYTRTGICTIVDMASLEIEVDVSESFLGRVVTGQRVQAVLDSYPDWKIPCRVIAIIPAADRQKATVKVRIGIDRLDPRILPDMGVKVAFQGSSEPAASASESAHGIVVAKSAILRNGDRDFVWVVKDGRIEKRAVKIGQMTGDEVQIAAGLAAGERVVLEGHASLRSGDRVKEMK